MNIETFKDVVATHIGVMSRTPRNRLKFVTPIIAALVVRLDEDVTDKVRKVVADHQSEWRNIMMGSGRIRRDTGSRWAGSIEFDLLHPRMLGGAHKRELMKALGVDLDALSLDHRILVVHSHIVVDLRGHDLGDLDRALRTQWQGPRRVHIESIRATGTVAENLSRIAGYVTKMRMQYSEAWEGGRTRYLCAFEPAWRRYISDLYRNVGLENLVVSNVRAQRVKSTPMKQKTLMPKGIGGVDGDQQLIMKHFLVQETTQEPLDISDGTNPSIPSPMDVLEKLRTRLAAVSFDLRQEDKGQHHHDKNFKVRGRGGCHDCFDFSSATSAQSYVARSEIDAMCSVPTDQYSATCVSIGDAARLQMYWCD